MTSLHVTKYPVCLQTGYFCKTVTFLHQRLPNFNHFGTNYKEPLTPESWHHTKPDSIVDFQSIYYLQTFSAAATVQVSLENNLHLFSFPWLSVAFREKVSGLPLLCTFAGRHECKSGCCQQRKQRTADQITDKVVLALSEISKCRLLRT